MMFAKLTHEQIKSKTEKNAPKSIGRAQLKKDTEPKTASTPASSPKQRRGTQNNRRKTNEDSLIDLVNKQ